MRIRPSVPVSFLLEVKDYNVGLEQEEQTLMDQEEKEGFSDQRDQRLAALRTEIEETEEFIDALELW